MIFNGGLKTDVVKVCQICGETKPIEEFVKCEKCKDGYRNRCRKCYSKINYAHTKAKGNSIQVEYKTCRECGIEKSVDNFNKSSSTIDGYNNLCKKCLINRRERHVKKCVIQAITKVCNKCQIEKPINEFRLYKYSVDGHKSICKDCTKIVDVEYRDSHREEHNTASKIWYDNNLDVARQTRRNYNFQHRDYLKRWREVNRKHLYEYRCKNKDEINRKMRIWTYRNRDKLHARQAQRRNFGYTSINNLFELSNGYHGHHLHIENNSNFVIYLPNFLHRLHNHNYKNVKSIITVNALALDFWINEELYKELYYEI